jgi:hypothetical protein
MKSGLKKSENGMPVQPCAKNSTCNASSSFLCRGQCRAGRGPRLLSWGRRCLAGSAARSPARDTDAWPPARGPPRGAPAPHEPPSPGAMEAPLLAFHLLTPATSSSSSTTTSTTASDGLLATCAASHSPLAGEPLVLGALWLGLARPLPACCCTHPWAVACVK